MVDSFSPIRAGKPGARAETCKMHNQMQMESGCSGGGHIPRKRSGVFPRQWVVLVTSRRCTKASRNVRRDLRKEIDGIGERVGGSWAENEDRETDKLPLPPVTVS